ncbi:MAG TPA: hypothetical protein VGQ15_15160 [Gaiellaceae bacterium]|nr:hypothetical protein [Gaiellaceae bacterium]
MRPDLPLAHGIGGIRDLPVPTWLFFYSATIVLVASFIALAVLWRRPVLERAAAGRPLPEGLQRLLLSRGLRVAAGAFSIGVFVVVAAAALVGDDHVLQNVAPTFVWVVFWVALVPFVVLFGNLWAVLSPFRAIADAVAWTAGRLGVHWRPEEYPERLGRWPGAVLLLFFVSFELAYENPSDPRALALGIYLYAAITWLGMFVFGREAWLHGGEAFNVYFGLLGRIAPFGLVDGRLVLRVPLSGLTRLDVVPGTLAFVSVMLGSVGFDSISRTSFWLDLQVRLGGELARTAISFVGLVGTVMAVALAYLAAVAAARALTGYEGDLAGPFLGSLVPIALVYVLAHYFSLLVLQGQYLVPLVSDPFGRGWDLIGTAGFRPNLGLLTPNIVWYAQVAALVAGHVAGLTLAHDRAVGLFASPRLAMRSQYAMLVLMVLYTVGGLKLLSTG